MPTEQPPVTNATLAADELGLSYELVFYGRVASAEEAAQRRGVAIGQLAKTLVVRVDEGDYVLVLVPGDEAMNYKKLRAHLGIRRLTMPDPDEAYRATGYRRGTITPLGAAVSPTIVDVRLTENRVISLGAGVSEWALHLDPADLVALPDVTVADVTGR